MLTLEQYEMLHGWAKEVIKSRCIVRGKIPAKEPGKTYSWMLYLRRGLFNADFSSAIAQMMLYKMYERIGNWNFQIAGRETGATPLLVAIPLVARVYDVRLNSFAVRKEQKTYGLYNWIEGMPNKYDTVLVDDLCNSSTSLRLACDKVIDQRIPLTNLAFTIVNKYNANSHSKERGKTDMYLPKVFEVISLYTLDDLDLEKPSH
jgi:orotate phosphoribosyltransferase